MKPLYKRAPCQISYWNQRHLWAHCPTAGQRHLQSRLFLIWFPGNSDALWIKWNLLPRLKSCPPRVSSAGVWKQELKECHSNKNPLWFSPMCNLKRRVGFWEPCPCFSVRDPTGPCWHQRPLKLSQETARACRTTCWGCSISSSGPAHEFAAMSWHGEKNEIRSHSPTPRSRRRWLFWTHATVGCLRMKRSVVIGETVLGRIGPPLTIRSQTKFFPGLDPKYTIPHPHPLGFSRQGFFM